MMRPAWTAGPPGQLVAGIAVGAVLALAVVGEPWLLHSWLLVFDALAVFDRWPALATATAVLLLMAATLPLPRLAQTQPRFLMLGVLVFALQMMSLRLGPLNLLNLGIPVLALWWLSDVVRRDELPRAVPLLTHLFVLLGVLVAISLFNREPVDSLRSLLIIAPKLAMACFLLQLLQSDADLRFVLRVLVLASLLAALVGVAQSGLYVFAGLELHLMEETAPRQITVFGLPLLRASGLMPNPQAYVHPLMIASLLVGYAWLLDGGGRSRWHPAGWGGIVLLLAAILLSFARGPWMALLLGLILLPAVVWPRRAPHWLAVIAMISLLGLWSGVGKWLIEVYGDFAAGSADVRVQLLGAGLEVLAEHPLRGVGMAQFEAFSPTIERYPVHNALLQMATEVGLPAMLVFVAILLLPVVRALRVLWRRPAAATHRLRALVLAYGVHLVAIQSDPMAYSEFVLFVVVLLDAAARIDGSDGAPAAAPRLPESADVR